MSHNIKNF